MGFGSGIQRGFPRYLVTLYMARQPGTPPQLGPADNQTGASLTGVYQDCDLQGVLWCYVTHHGIIRPSVSARRSAMGATLRARSQKSRVGSGSCECGVLQATLSTPWNTGRPPAVYSVRRLARSSARGPFLAAFGSPYLHTAHNTGTLSGFCFARCCKYTRPVVAFFTEIDRARRGERVSALMRGQMHRYTCILYGRS